MSPLPGNPWFRRYPAAEPPAARVIGFHHAGGSASLFRTWSRSLPAWLETVGVQLPGREDRLGEVPLRSISRVVEELERRVEPFFDVPVYFFGHSMGALIAFELTRALRRSSRPSPAHLFLSGRWAAHWRDPVPPLSMLPRDEFLEAVRRFEGTAPEVFAHPELLDLVLPVLRADFELCESYRYVDEAPLDTPVTAFGGLADAAVPAASVEQWSAQTAAAFRLRLFPGGHFFVRSAQAALLADISSTVAETAGRA